jgi:hypothetical protein
MQAVLGIDAAWTLTQPSGVALVAERRSGWRMVAAEPSYQRFQIRPKTDLPTEARPRVSPPDPAALLVSASMYCGCSVSFHGKRV